MLPRNPYLDKEFRKRQRVTYKHEDGSELTDAEVEEFWKEFKTLTDLCRKTLPSTAVMFSLDDDADGRALIEIIVETSEYEQVLKSDWVPRFEALPIANRLVVVVTVGLAPMVKPRALITAAEFHALGKEEESPKWWWWPF